MPPISADQDRLAQVDFVLPHADIILPLRNPVANHIPDLDNKAMITSRREANDELTRARGTFLSAYQRNCVCCCTGPSGKWV